MRAKNLVSRDADPMIADDTPGPGAYEWERRKSMAVKPGGPAYTMRAKIKLSAQADPLVVDAGPGPGQYDTAKY